MRGGGTKERGRAGSCSVFYCFVTAVFKVEALKVFKDVFKKIVAPSLREEMSFACNPSSNRHL